MGAFWVKRAAQWFYASAGLIRPRNATDRTSLGNADQGSGSILSVDSGSTTGLAILTKGYVQADTLVVTANSSCAPGIVLTETTNDFTCLVFLAVTGGTSSNAAVYVKNNQFVIGFICGANGQMRYLSIALDGFTCTWSARSVGP